MAIQIQRRPYNYCFSGNPVHYQLYSELAAADDTVFLEVRVQFKNIGGEYVPTESLPYFPTEGIAKIDIQDILEGLLNYELPQFDANEKKIWEALQQTGMFYLEYREVTSTNPDPSWDSTEAGHECFVVKGGLSRFKYQGNNFWVNYFEPVQPFFTWQVNGRKAAYDERMYLAFLCDEVPAGVYLRAVLKVTYTDGYIDDQEYVEFVAKKGVMFYIPAGAKQWNAEELQPDKTILNWTLQVFDYSVPAAPVAMSEAFEYEQDNINDYNGLTIAYRNSLGGLDTVRVRGVIKYDLEYTFTEQARTTRVDYYSGHFFDPQSTVFNNSELQFLRGDIGHLDKEEQDRLRDAFLKRETWTERGGKWVPLKIVTKNLTQKTSDQTKWNLPLDFTLAHDGDYFYTPESVDLGAGVFTDNVCLAFLSNFVVILKASADPNKKIVAISFQENDPQNAAGNLRYRVLNEDGTAVIIDWTTVAMVTPLEFEVAKDAIYTYELQPICTFDIYGRKSVGQVNTSGDVFGGFDDPDLPQYNSQVINDGSRSTNVEVSYSDLSMGTNSGFAGAFSSFSFNVADKLAVTVFVKLLDTSPSSVTLWSNDVWYSPTAFSGGQVQFDGVNIEGGVKIYIGAPIPNQGGGPGPGGGGGIVE